MSTTTHLDKLNAAQRKAVTHGEALPEKGYRAGPLLIVAGAGTGDDQQRSEEHTSELQSRRDLVCRLLLEKKKKKNSNTEDRSHNSADNRAFLENQESE